MGKVMLRMAKMLGPRRTLLRTPQNYRGGNNFTDVNLIEKSPTEFEMWMNYAGNFATLVAGSLEGTLVVAGARNPKVEVVGSTFPEATFRITWAE